MNSLERLFSIASSPLAAKAGVADCLTVSASRCARALQSMLDRMNGLTAFDSALVVFPTMGRAECQSLDDWNRLDGWRRWYDEVPRDAIFFAQDLFGGQFAITSEGIARFDSECGSFTGYSKALAGWAKRLIANSAENTAWPLAAAWQATNGALPPGQRLLPKVPFVLGGAYEADNLIAVESRQGMEWWGCLYQQIRNVPDGDSVTISGWLA